MRTTGTTTRLRLLLGLATAGALLTACGTDPGGGEATDALPSGKPSPTTSVPGGPGTADDPTGSDPAPSGPGEPAAPGKGTGNADVVTTVPGDFPLAAGLPRTNGDDGTPVTVTDRPTWSTIELCGETVWSQDEPVARLDLAGASYTGEAEDSRSRVLAVYADELAAQAALDGVRDAYEACPSAEEGGTDQVYEVVETQQGSATITHRYRTDGRFDTGLEVIELVAIGNALYLSSYYGEGGGSAETIASAIAFARESSQPVWDAMAVFADGDAAADPVPSDPPADPAEGLGLVDLAAGWPTEAESDLDGPEVPVTELDAVFADYACGTAAPEADDSGVVRGQFSNVEDYRTRELHVFPDADAAVAWVGELRAFYDACPTGTDPDSPGLAYPITLLDTEVGGQSFGVIRSTTYDGEPAIGLSALHVVRVGSAVLVDTISGEGSAPDPEVDGRARLAWMTEQSAELVASMCAFTEADC